MSARIHEIAKQYNIEPKEMLSWLKQQGFVAADTKSVSSTVSKIYYDEIAKQFAKPEPAPVEVTPEPAAPAAVVEPARVKLPAGVFVKSAQDIQREKDEAAKAAAAARAAASATVVSAPPVVVPKPMPAPAPMVKSAPLPPPPVSAPRFAPAPAQVAKPAPAPMMRPPVAPAPMAKAPVAPPPVPAARPFVPPPSPGAKPTSFVQPSPTAPAASSMTVTEEGGVKIIHLKPPIIVRDFAVALGLKPFKLISELMEMSIFASMNQSIDEAVANKLAEKHGFLLDIKHRGETQAPAPTPEKVKQTKEEKAREEDLKNLAPRPPVVVIMGHVDHGKTSLLDAIRKANVAAGEAGGITQHIGAYQIEHNNRKITFLDTPGHAAFTKMRARGASVTDIAVLVVAADDGFMPQTDEALKHAQDAKVALMVAVNKMDVKGANLDRVKQQMQERQITPEDWGGEIVTVPVAAIKGQGITELLEMILLQADVLELKANPKAEASGVVVESEVDVGRGPLATVIVQRGTLRVGDAIVCGPHWAKVRAMFDDKGQNIKEAPPSMPVRVIGWSSSPDSGSKFMAVKNAREAENLAEEEEHRQKKEAVSAAAAPKDTSLDALFANIAAVQAKTLKVVLKSDVYGSVEAVRNVLEGIKSAKVSLEVVSAEVGIITKNDVLMAAPSKATIIGFNTKQENGVTALAKHHGVTIESFEIIYELGDRVREMMADLLEPDLKENKLGGAEVRQVFPVAKGFVAGCLVTEGKVNRGITARVRRGKEIMFEGKVGTLRRFKDDANEVRAGLECGIRLDGYDGYQPGDRIECYEIQKVRASL
ncbi:translation initiation factor IF-2 [Oleiharenicola lentus]|uniref:Translation initiation factor IF-2 n=1 Tax=Oleiharenicola lentus TaxID=2508720 RepID=A0A4Q1C3M7_9BACT|nr:translation initiation factor IF-2 [Oleiharenicola lentus]RXK52825.1 translation initiation factor IF-2 [Oleiharenicola lentus]